jgi:hypothetical protein
VDLCERSSLDHQIAKIVDKFKIPIEFSIHFPQVMLITFELTVVIFNEIEKINISLDESYAGFPIKISVTQDNDQSNKYYASKIFGHNFTLLINCYDEYKYAINLLNVYKYMIKPFMIENELKLSNISDLYKRFYYFRTPFKPNHYVGKTMVSENIETFASPHFPYHSPTFVENIYYLSHFRVKYELQKIESSITSFHFDYSYFLCYFKPLFNALT